MINLQDLHLGQLVQLPFGGWVGPPPKPELGHRVGEVVFIGHWRVHVRLESGTVVSANPSQLTALY